MFYKLGTAIKGQALADFLVEFTYSENPSEEVALSNLPLELQPAIPTWVLYVDGSSNKQGSGAGIILPLEYALRFEFQAFNNEVEYKSLLVGLQLATSMGAQQIKVHNDSQLIVNQVLLQYEAREENMVAYLTLVREVTNKLKGLSITQILKEENA